MSNRHHGQPLEPSRATDFIRGKVNVHLEVCLTQHAKDQMAERELIMGDVTHVLKHGFVLENGEPATQPGLFKYKMDCSTPNSNGRDVRVVVIPTQSCMVKIVTVMWVDEDRQRG
ncbi:DUF4258 domain-containing protein [Parvibaculum sp.]|uniref:DUF4258 domain-containing protein n=1 Tax=Parvibaculum sp. TaxID=2024848 RepID=UPI001B1DFF99|nr:DUF4258 domain-containing protein [Parvibaculum sp.]MBO6635190.1 DUF4258 domain-containing protein [Parvibaculum sp.]MBO6678570.1 DUF4258 domain-containing protein [Parvibaculum sp.]MBO6684079.1 DUF4258 domain-containing protein [Parvibaculum sp.]MBO6903763.1 DUF4258 domain-containing protein [Parvibaculum sp.]